MKVISILIGLLIIGGLVFTILDGNEAEESTRADDAEVTEETQEEVVTDDEETVQETDGEIEESDTTERVFTLDSFSFGYSETELRVNMGDTVTINLTNSDGFHDWVVDEFGAATDKIKAGGNTSVTFVADQAGTFEYYCSVGSHRANGMVGKLVVE